jgi:hypothetical protein
LTITFPSLQESGGAGVHKPTTGAQKTGRGRQRRHIRFPSLRPSCPFTPLRRKRLTFRSPLSSEYEARFKVAMQKVTRSTRGNGFSFTPRPSLQDRSRHAASSQAIASTRAHLLTVSESAGRHDICPRGRSPREANGRDAPAAGAMTRGDLRGSMRWLMRPAKFGRRRRRRIAAQDETATRAQLASVSPRMFGPMKLLGGEALP